MCERRLDAATSRPADRKLTVRPGSGTALQVEVNGTILTQSTAGELTLGWAGAGNTSGFGNLMDGAHPTWTGDFSGVGSTQVLFHYRGDHHWWLGTPDASRHIAWALAGDTAGFGDLLDGAHQFFNGNFDVQHPNQTQLLFYYRGDGNWWLGSVSGGQLTWRNVGNTTGFGNLMDGAHQFWTGRFSTSDRTQLIFHYRGDSNWWLGELAGSQIGWTLAGNTAGFGNLLDGSHPLWTGDFTAVGRTSLMFHYKGDSNWWLGTIAATKSLSWVLVGNTSGFGNLLDGSHPLWTGAFQSAGRTSLLFHYRGDHNWWLGTLNSTSQLTWALVGNTAGFGDLLDGAHRFWSGAFGGATDEMLFHYRGDANWWSGVIQGGSLVWNLPGNTRGFGNLLDGHHQFWTAPFSGTKKTDLLFYDRDDGNWWLGTFDDVRIPLPHALSPGDQVVIKSPASSTDKSNTVAVSHDYATQHYDRSRTGWNFRETALTPGAVAQLHPLFTMATNDQVYAQPLYAEGVAFVGRSGLANVLYVASEAGTVYAFDADGGALLASRSLIPAGEAPVPTADIYVPPWFNISPVISITGTPVIDRATNSLFVVVKSKAGANQYHQRIHHLDLGSLGEKPSTNVEINPPYPGVAFDPLANSQRPALLLSHDTLYVGFGSHEDRPNWHGWLVAFDAKTLNQQAVFNASPILGGGGGIWQCGHGPAADLDGNVFFATGNGIDFNAATHLLTNTVIKLGPSLALLDSFTPFTQHFLNQSDWDLGSGGVLVLPDQPGAPHKLAVAAGKQGFVYLLNRDTMGGYHAGGPDNVVNVQELYPGHAAVSAGNPIGSDAGTVGMYGGAGYFGGSTGQKIYIAGATGDGQVGQLVSFDLAAGTLSNRQQSTRVVGPATTFVTSNGTDPSSAVVWTLRRGNPLELIAFRADNLGTQLCDVNAGPWINPVGGAFVQPTVIAGRVYVPSSTGVTALGP